MRSGKHYTELIKEGKQVEAEDTARAIDLYEAAIKQSPFEEFPYSRLMTIYRKLKMPKEELRVIEKALGLYQQHYDQISEMFTKKHAKVASLSKAILKNIAGGKTGRAIHQNYPEPIPKWLKRRVAAEKKLKNP